MEIDNFLIFKNKHKKEGTQQPDYRIKTRVDGQFIDWGAGWIKDGKDGKYISCSKSKPYEKKQDLKSNHDVTPKDEINDVDW